MLAAQLPKKKSFNNFYLTEADRFWSNEEEWCRIRSVSESGTFPFSLDKEDESVGGG
ncbi:hypothetical protein MKY84_04805 [Chryseomicrobium sp. FSL W7-1435]|uniref:hypothetical protein n=1 Tax=Chryseomicrobium sp. FSL W7-1435 TaxID=2921704 RepID=UPI00315A4557